MDYETKVFAIAAILGLAMVSLAGCDDSSSSMEELEHHPNVALQLTGLSDVGPDYVYEGWLIHGSDVVSGGRFSVTAGETAMVELELDPDAVETAETYIITIEPAVGDDPAPSSVHVLGGNFSGSLADLTISHPGAIGTDFANASGSFILATPTTAITEDNANGIWFLMPGETKAPSLDLPALPTGWVYEGWVVGANGPVSTGRFTDAGAADDDGAGPTAGPDGAPPFPGQDYIDPALVLTDGFVAVITVEPEPDTSDAPFAIKPLVLEPITTQLAPDAQSLENRAAATSPTGTATKL